MMDRDKMPALGRARMMMGTALASTLVIATGANAQQTADTPPIEETTQDGGLEEILVTAQRREQSLQDVPIAITAVTQEALLVNRVTSVIDLNGLAPGVTVRATGGGVAIPAITSRGVLSFGVVPGSDKQVSIYLDGVYIGSPRGSSFELPDIARLEVLRGPQGTLFGRNATAGAINIITRQPTGDVSARQEFTIGNFDQVRVRTTVDLPAFGPFSAYGSFIYNKRDGDIRNTGAGTRQDYTGPNTGRGVLFSPRTLGAKDADTFFAALKFEPSDKFRMTYKFDHARNNFTPEGQAPIAINPNAPLIGSLLTALINSAPVPPVLATDGRRPTSVNNAFAIPSRQRNTGHSLTTEWKPSDNLAIKNITAYRKANIDVVTQLDGLGGLVLTPQALGPYAVFVAFSSVPGLGTAPPAVQGATIQAIAGQLAPAIGSRFLVFGNSQQTSGDQFSSEVQVNYDSDLVTVTAGGLYFTQDDKSGSAPGVATNFAFTPVPMNGRIPLGGQSLNFNEGTSLAAYAQAEFHLTPQVDVIGGARITRDRKSGSLALGGRFVPGPNGFIDGTFTGITTQSFSYRDTRPNYLIGVNYQPNRNILLFAKYSTAFVSGGSVGGLDFDPETVRSFEGGIKADLLGRRLRTNVALFHAKYKNLQSAQGGTNVGRPDLGTVVIDQGDSTAYGFEAEVTALPFEGVTLSGSLGYTDIDFGTVNPILIASSGGAYRDAPGIPKYTANLSGEYETPFVFGETRLLIRVDANWQSRRFNDANPNRANLAPGYDVYNSTDPFWIVNGRVALRDFKIGPAKAEVAVFGRNIFNNRDPSFILGFTNFLVSSSFNPARTYGLDVFFRF